MIFVLDFDREVCYVNRMKKMKKEFDRIIEFVYVGVCLIGGGRVSSQIRMSV